MFLSSLLYKFIDGRNIYTAKELEENGFNYYGIGI
jgi:hypothetical protein